jgi:hypothetical protein
MDQKPSLDGTAIAERASSPRGLSKFRQHSMRIERGGSGMLVRDGAASQGYRFS